MREELPAELIIPSGAPRAHKEVYGFATGVVLWSALVAQLYFSHWAGVCAGRWLCTLVLMPLATFLFMFLLVQVSLLLAVIPTHFFKLSRASYDRFACGLVLGGLSLVSYFLLQEVNPLAHVLGWLWWAGLTFCILVNWVGRSQPEEHPAPLGMGARQ